MSQIEIISASAGSGKTYRLTLSNQSRNVRCFSKVEMSGSVSAMDG